MLKTLVFNPSDTTRGLLSEDTAERQTDEALMQRLAAQETLFSARMSRIALHNVALPQINQDKKAVVNVWRNHNFESIESFIRPFLAYSGWSAEFRTSAYDDSLSFLGHSPADAEVIWLDSSRFEQMTKDEWIDWLRERLSALRGMTTAPIILATWCDSSDTVCALQTMTDTLVSVYFADIGATCLESDAPLIDSRSSNLAGTPLSSAAQLIIARKLACHWLPAVLQPPVKAVALDLDNTLHAGVLGEDGVEGVQLTPGHARLQHHIKFLRKQGIFIALVSRNVLSDVEALFTRREDYPLRWMDFSAVEVSWGDKAAALVRIAQTLCISTDAVLFVDDNPGELASVAHHLPSTPLLYADSDATATQRALAFYPGLWRWRLDETDTRRVNDLEAQAARASLAKGTESSQSYFHSLQVKIAFNYKPVTQLSRLSDLCRKTNQFNLSLRRFNEAELALHLSRSDACVASARLTDRFADSGVIAVLVATRHSDQLRIEELCISCRAMGRQLEDSIILPLVRGMALYSGCQTVAFQVAHGPRNQPALDWLAKLCGLSSPPEPGLCVVPVERFNAFTPLVEIIEIKE